MGMRIVVGLLAVAAWVLPGCLSFNLGGKKTSTDGGATTDAAVVDGAKVDVGAPPAAGPQGIDCATDPYTGTILCSGVSSCPGLLVDHDVYPDCGFRIRGTSFDLQCPCYGGLCPIGSPSTCQDAAALLDAQSEYTVCAQYNEGRCTAK